MSDADDRLQRAALDRLLALGQVREDELARDLGADTAAERDPVDRAIRDLVRAGLVHRHDEFVSPSRAARRFHELSGT